MPLDLAEFSAGISFAALAIATYGIFERGKTASRAERVRLTTIVGELAKTRGELVDIAMKGQTIGDMIEVLHTRQELLSQQARSLIQGHELTITSSECREVAFNLAETSFNDDADAMWQLAVETAKAEGKTQLLYANRGYAWFLFSAGREDEAREILNELLSEYTEDNDSDRLVRAQTISTWAGWEVRTEGDSTPVIAEFSRQIIELANASTTPRTKQMVMQHAFTVVNGTAVHVVQGQPSGDQGVPPTR
jgi:hypothetical protein